MRIKAVVQLLLVLFAACNKERESDDDLKIYGGQSATAAQKEYTVLLHVGTEGICTGTLLCDQLTASSGWVLTAGHCVKDSSGREKAIQSILVGGQRARCNLRGDAVPHDRAPSSALSGWFQRENDVGLIPFGGCALSEITRQSCVQLPARDTPLQPGAFGTRVDLAGYGRRTAAGAPGVLSSLQQVTFDLIDRRTCKIFRFSNTNNICGGDSGGPMVASLAGKPTVVGVANRGTCDRTFASYVDELQPGDAERADITNMQRTYPELYPTDMRFWASSTDMRCYVDWARTTIAAHP